MNVTFVEMAAYVDGDESPVDELCVTNNVVSGLFAVSAHGRMNHQQPWSEVIAAQFQAEFGAEVVFEHRGAVDPDVVQQLLSVAENASVSAGDPVPLRKRLFNLLLEGLENVHRHVAEEHRTTPWAVLLRVPDGYRISIGNAMPVAMAALLTYRVGILNEMDENDLKEHYRLLLANDARTERGGAGLGLLTMARKSVLPIVARSYSMDERTAYLMLELSVSR